MSDDDYKYILFHDSLVQIVYGKLIFNKNKIYNFLFFQKIHFNAHFLQKIKTMPVVLLKKFSPWLSQIFTHYHCVNHVKNPFLDSLSRSADVTCAFSTFTPSFNSDCYFRLTVNSSSAFVRR